MGKYLRRSDAFKIIAARETLFVKHMHVAHALEPDADNDWFPIVANNLRDPSLCVNVLLYWRDSEMSAGTAA